MQCPICHAALIAAGKFSVCPEHGVVAPSGSPAPASLSRSQRVFISYGRADASEFAGRLSGDLATRGGHDVFIDQDGIEKGGLWEVRIEQGIRRSTVVAAIMTRRSQDDDSVCRDEVAFALNEAKQVVPIKADPDPRFRPSLLLARRNWIDFSSNYDAGLEALLRYLQGDSSALREPALPTISGVVPLDFGPEIARFTADFVGRAWVGREVDRWLTAERQRAMVIVAEPGVGKSAIAAWLSQVRSAAVIGIHFCTQQNSRSRDPQEFVANLVSQLYARLPGFADAVEAKQPEQQRATAADAFRELVVEVTRGLPPQETRRLIIVDSLDEAMQQSGETVLEVLVQHASDLPEWLRIIATTRPEEPILQRIRTLSVFELSAERPENRADVRLYIEQRLASHDLHSRLQATLPADAAARLEALSEGNYLYARMALDALLDGSIHSTDLARLSPGLATFFFETFRRRYPDIDAYVRRSAPLLRALAAARTPLPLPLLAAVAGDEVETVRLRLHDLRSYLRVQGAGIAATYALYHRSLKDWLTDSDAAGPYWCRTDTGHRSLSAIGWNAYTAGTLGRDEYFRRHLADHLTGAEEWDHLEQLLTDLDLLEDVWRRGGKYEWMRHWQNLRGPVDPGVSYERALSRVVANATPKRVAQLSDIIGWFLRDMGLLAAAQPFMERAFQIHDRGADDPTDLADSAHGLAELYRAQKKFGVAQPLYERALRIREQHFGRASREVATSLHDLAELHHDLCQGLTDVQAKRLAATPALGFYTQSLSIRQVTLPPGDPAIADCLNDRGTLYYELGQLEQAVPDYRMALQIWESAFGPDHPDIASALHNISRISLAEGRPDEAITQCARAYAILESTFGPNHSKSRRCAATLAYHHAAAGRLAPAIAIRLRLLTAQEQALGSHHVDLVDNLSELFKLQKAAGDRASETVTCNRLVTLLERLSMALLQLGEHADSIALAREGVAIRAQQSEPDEEGTASALNTLVRCLQEGGDHESALPLARQALAIRKARLPGNHPNLGVSLNNLGLTLVCLSQLDEALATLTEAVTVNPVSPYPHYWLARLYQRRGADGDAIREAASWYDYLRLGSTSAGRRQEALGRIAALGGTLPRPDDRPS